MDNSTSKALTGKILFVDDEPSVLKSLRREFIDADYDIYEAQSAQEGLRILEGEDIDAVVSDYKMPGMDGIEFLKIVMKKFPATYRVMLSGFIEESAVLKALSSGLVTTYISKPWQADALHHTLKHLFLTRQVLKNVEILKTVNSIEELPALPRVYNEFVQAVEVERPYNELASIIKSDIATTTMLLRVASSAYFHLDKDISIERALSYLGINVIRRILLFASLADGTGWDGARREHLHNISVHSVLMNYSIGELYNVRFNKLLPEHYSSIGITHDIGKVIMLGHLPDRYDAAIANMQNNPGTDFYRSELALGFAGATHVEIGAFFLDLWGLPRGSIEASLYHHDFWDHKESSQDILEICQVADLLSNFVASYPDTTNEELPSFMERYKEKGSVCDLLTKLKEKYESLRQ
jgi:CheY-like chemotaxis protein/HD-like signal output (HDOD) protein